MPFMYSSATADLGILEGRLTAARAAALDELLAANIPTDLANNLTAIQLNELETDAATRVAAIQANLANIETDTIAIGAETTAILADVTGIAGAAMRGTDNSLLAANYKSFSTYYYTGALADGTVYVPAADTIVHLGYIDRTPPAEVDWFVKGPPGVNLPLIDAFLHICGQNKRTIKGPVWCDGTNIGFNNKTGGQGTIHLMGVSYG